MPQNIKQRPSWDRVVRIKEQIHVAGTGRTRFYELSKDPDFPEEIILGKRARGRWLSELIAFIESRKHRSAWLREEGSDDA
ncbi:MAG: AlpA family phage regulatory protein [Paracoccaceae bacterium]|nr:AlpA family phage regulatory protein [Paracoccaceae bacterium]